MMGYGYNMMGWGGSWGIIGVIAPLFWLVVLADLVLAGIWLWQQINKK